jgi:hypothetical protein
MSFTSFLCRRLQYLNLNIAWMSGTYIVTCWLVTRQIICGFRILCSAYWINRQAELQSLHSQSHCTAVRIQLCNHTWNLHRLTSCILPPLLSGTSCVPLYSHPHDSLCLEQASYSLYNHRNDHTENISAYIVDMCVLSHCIATVATLTA